MSQTFQFLKDCGLKKRRDRYILDEFDSEFYLIFDTADDPETPTSIGTVDILIQKTGESPFDPSIRIVADANMHGVMRVLAALGIQRFNDKVKTAYYQMGNPLR